MDNGMDGISKAVPCVPELYNICTESVRVSGEKVRKLQRFYLFIYFIWKKLLAEVAIIHKEV
jgi:hypothetical protein